MATNHKQIMTDNLSGIAARVLCVALASLLLTMGASAQLNCDPSWTAAYKCMQHCGPCPNGGGTPPPPPPIPTPEQLNQREIANLYQQGMHAFNRGEYWTSIEFFRRALERRPRPERESAIRQQIGFAYRNMAVLALERGDADESDRLFELGHGWVHDQHAVGAEKRWIGDQYAALAVRLQAERSLGDAAAYIPTDMRNLARLAAKYDPDKHGWRWQNWRDRHEGVLFQLSVQETERKRREAAEEAERLRRAEALRQQQDREQLERRTKELHEQQAKQDEQTLRDIAAILAKPLRERSLHDQHPAKAARNIEFMGVQTSEPPVPLVDDKPRAPDPRKVSGDWAIMELAATVYDTKTMPGKNPFAGNQDWKMLEIADARALPEIRTALKATGFNAYSYVNERTKTLVIAVQGSRLPGLDSASHPDTRKDLAQDWWVNDIKKALLAGATPPQFQIARQYVEAVKNAYGDKYTIVCSGHSLGGGACAYAAGMEGVRAVVLNPISSSASTPPKNAHLIDNYVVENELAYTAYGVADRPLIGHHYRINNYRTGGSVAKAVGGAIVDHGADVALNNLARQIGIERIK